MSSHVNWCIANKKAVRVVLLFRSLWLGTLYKQPLDCIPIFSHALKLSFSVSFMYPSYMLSLLREKTYKGLRLRFTAYIYGFTKGLGPKPYAVKQLKIWSPKLLKCYTG